MSREVNFYVKSHAPADLKRLYLDNSLSYIYNHTTTNQNYPGTESVITAKYDIGIDIGSVSVNTVVMDGDDAIVEERYDYCHGKPFNVLNDVLEELIRKYGDEGMGYVALTGTGGTLGSELLGGLFVNEIVAQSSSVARLYPRIRTIIEMGGEDSKLIFMEGSGSAVQLEDFAMNSICAAGTGSFLDQQARRIGVSIEKEFGELAMKSENPPRIAGRCSVFAKSDMIHLQQIATPVHDIVAGLCFAVARNFKSSLAQGKKVGCGAFTEPGAGSDFAHIQSTAKKDGKDYILNGEKMWISLATAADFAVVTVRTDQNSDQAYQGLSTFLVNLESPGITRGDIHGKLGVRAGSTGWINFQNVRVPAENMLGEEGEGFKVTMTAFDRGRYTVAAGATG